MSDGKDAALCELCGHKVVLKRDEEVSFSQWTDRGYVQWSVTIPVAVCGRCGTRNWDEAAEIHLEEAFRSEYDKLP